MHLDKYFSSWLNRSLTIFGKVIVINTLAIPKLIYNFTILPVPEHVIIKLENIITNFLWPNRSRINRNCLIDIVENGGINVVDIRSKITSLKATWVTKWLKKPIWSPMGNIFLHNINLTFDICVNMYLTNKHSIFDNIPIFYQDVWNSYYQCKTVVCYNIII